MHDNPALATAAAAAAPSEATAAAALPVTPTAAALLVLFNAPNCVCWLRLALMLVGVHKALSGQPVTAFWLFGASMALDAVDGWMARKLGQVRN
jgi:phosphatidylglycerophosphate synthase